MQTTHEQLSLDEAVQELSIWRFAESFPDAAFTRGFVDDVNASSGNSKTRQIWMPNKPMLSLHRRFLAHLRALKIDMPYATGGRPGQSPASHVERHSAGRYFYTLDISRAYEQVEADNLASQLCFLDPGLGGPEMIGSFLKQYCILPDGKGLLTGAPSSPELFNIYLLPLDEALGSLAKQHGLVYSRYLDDLCFSAPSGGYQERERIGKHKRRSIRSIINQFGLEINHSKCHVWELSGDSGGVNITGLQLNPGGYYQLPTRYRQHIMRQFREFRAKVRLAPLSETDRSQFAGLWGSVKSNIDRRPLFYRLGDRRLLRLGEEIISMDKRRRKAKRLPA